MVIAILFEPNKECSLCYLYTLFRNFFFWIKYNIVLIAEQELTKQIEKYYKDLCNTFMAGGGD